MYQKSKNNRVISQKTTMSFTPRRVIDTIQFPSDMLLLLRE